MADPDWRGGRYYGVSFPHRGQRIAREIGTITYRSGPEWQERFGRERGDDGPPRLDEDFQVERYLAHQGDKFCLQYDANSYLYISKAMDLFDLLEDDGDGPLVDADPLPRARDRRDDRRALPGLAAARAGRGAREATRAASPTSSSTPPTATTPS